MTQKNSLMQFSAVDEVLPFSRLLLLGLRGYYGALLVSG
jgi:hypothetical protein